MSRPVPAPQPDLSSRLLAAVAERDAALASRLGQQWVHRKGLAALDRFLLTALAPSQGLDAAQWLRGQLGLMAPSLIEPNAIDELPIEAVPIGEVPIEEVPIDELELAALETQMAASPELLDLDPSEQEGSPATRPAALFGRMKALLRQCLEEAIVGIDDVEPEAEPEPFEPISSAPVGIPSETATPAAEPARRLAVVPPLQASTTPAPAPASLAALRAWLPDGEEDGRDLPRAC